MSGDMEVKGPHGPSQYLELAEHILELKSRTYANEWAKWEKKLREILFSSAEYLNDIQVPFEFAVGKVLEQLKEVAKGDFSTPTAERKKLGTIVFAAVSLPVSEVQDLITNISKTNSDVEAFIKEKRLDETLTKAHVTLAHKRSHGIVAVANYGQFLNQKFPVELTAFLFSDKLATLEARLGSIDGEKVDSLNEWPHVTVWFGEGASAKDADTLPQLLLQGKVNRVEIDPPCVVSGEVKFF